MPSRKRFVKAYLDDADYDRVAAMAGQAGLSISKFVARVCLAQEIKSTVDQKAVLALLKSNADLGRLGGVIKYHLSTTPESGYSWRAELRATLKFIEASKREGSSKRNQESH